jgi:PAS domain S-box-containing protein
MNESSNPALREQAHAEGRRRRLEWAALIAALLLLGAVITAWRWHAYRAADRQEREQLHVQARSAAGHLGLLLQAVSKALQSVRVDARLADVTSDPAAASALLGSLNDMATAAGSLQIADAAGVVRASSRADLIGTSLADQSCFRRARDRPDADLLYVCEPFKTATGVWSFSVLRTRRSDAGPFAGVVAATLDTVYLGAALPSALYASDMRAFLLSADGIVIVGVPAGALPAGTDLGRRAGSLFNRYRGADRADKTLEGTWQQGGVERIVAYHGVAPAGLRLDEPPVLTLSRGTASTFEPWLLTSALFAALWWIKAGASAVALHLVQRNRRALASQAEVLQEQRLEELERIELVVTAAQLSLWVWHVADNRMEIDTRWCAMVGCPADDLGRAAATWRGRVHPDDLAAVNEGRAGQLAGDRGAEQFEYRMRHDDGSWVWVLTRGKVVERDPAGVALRLAGTHQDITERKRAEEAVRRSEENLATTLQSIGDAVIATDAQGRIARMNATAERLTGWPLHEALGRPLPEVFRIIDGRTRQPAIDPVQQALANGQSVALANGTTLIARDGHERQVDDSAAPIRDAAGAITGVVLVFSGVTEAYRIQEALRDSEAQLRLVTEAMPGTVARYDLQRRFVFANGTHKKWLGLAPEALIGRTLGEIYGEEHMGTLEPFIRRVEAGEPVSFETRFAPAAEGPIHRLVTLSPDRDTEGTVRGHFAIVIDISDLRAAEAERRVLEEHLRESQKMDSIGTLAGGIAHDFNNVLGAIIGNAELAKEEVGAGHPARVSLEQISRASQRARSLVQQILTFSRKQPEHLVNQALQPLIEESLALLRSTLPARVELVTEIAEAALYVNADATQIQQVLMNLGTNAWHALHGSTGRIAVGLDSVALAEGQGPAGLNLPPGQYAHLWVSDDGAGMDAATRRRIFEPFFTTKPVGQGTGLGLSVVHGIVRTHLGAITVDTAPGQGTSFHLYLPATQRPSQVGALDEAEVRVTRGRGQHVMYVDDDDVMVLMVERLLARAGYRVTACRSAKQALAAFIDNPRAFDVVVTDFNMPGFSGLELAAELAYIRPDLPLVITSGHVSEELRSGALRHGIRHLMQKQNTLEELGTIVHRALAEAGAVRDSMH